MKRFVLNIALLLIISIVLTLLTISLTTPQSEIRVSYPESSALLNKMFVQFSVSRHSVPTQNVPLDEIMNGPLLQDDPRILKYIRERDFLVPPSSDPYELNQPNEDPSMGQSTLVKRILRNQKNGFFIECGALDGETRSNTLDLEMNFGWKGLLIEGDPKNQELLSRKNRKAWVAKACLATKPYPHQVFFKQNFNVGKISQDSVVGQEKRPEDVRVQCFPIYSLLSALNVTVVDYFSLDVEGHEYQVLQTIPFDKLLIRVLSVEYIHDAEGENEIERFMSGKGYRVVTRVTNGNNLANDLILVHESVKVSEVIKPIRT